jgi:Flp pilus assembly protein TadG
VSSVEFGFIAGPLLLLLFGALQIFLLFLAQQVLETAVETSGRTIMTGSAQDAKTTAAGFHTTVCNAIPAFLTCSNVMVDVNVATSFSGANTSKPTLTYDQNGNVTNAWNFNMGQPGSVVVVRLLYQWPVFNLLSLQLGNLSNGSRLLMATAVFKNEAFK